MGTRAWKLPYSVITENSPHLWGILVNAATSTSSLSLVEAGFLLYRKAVSRYPMKGGMFTFR